MGKTFLEVGKNHLFISRADDSRRSTPQQGQLRRLGLTRRGCWPEGGKGAQCQRGATVERHGGIGIDGLAFPSAAPRPGRLALRLLRSSQLRVIRKHGALPPLPNQRITDTVRAKTEPSAQSEGESAEISSRDCQRYARMRPLLLR